VNGTGPEAALMRNIVAAYSAYERLVIKARAKAALAVKKARGERVGGMPYGWRDGDGNLLVEDEAEQATVARAREIRAEGASLREVGRRLLEEGHGPRVGKGWRVQVGARLFTGRGASPQAYTWASGGKRM
jgi:DNA invertase Pin-like site-specific DNA recombinase